MLKGGINMGRRKEPTAGWFGSKLGKRDSNGRVIVSSLQSSLTGSELRLEPFSESTVVMVPNSRTGVLSPPESKRPKNE